MVLFYFILSLVISVESLSDYAKSLITPPPPRDPAENRDRTQSEMKEAFLASKIAKLKKKIEISYTIF